MEQVFKVATTGGWLVLAAGRYSIACAGEIALLSSFKSPKSFEIAKAAGE
jgi:hypothetical protein